MGMSLKVMLLSLLLMGDYGEGTWSNRILVDFIGIEAGLSQFEAVTGRLPSEDEGLAALVDGPNDLPDGVEWLPIFESISLDPWGSEYGYVVSDEYEEGYGLYCLGMDGVSKTRGNDADDWNTWTENEQHEWVRDHRPDWGLVILWGMVGFVVVGSVWTIVKGRKS